MTGCGDNWCLRVASWAGPVGGAWKAGMGGSGQVQGSEVGMGVGIEGPAAGFHSAFSLPPGGLAGTVLGRQILPGSSAQAGLR